MRDAFKIAFIALAMGGSSLAVGVPAAVAADEVVTTPGIAFGYNDGYWDRGHAWHSWSSQEETTTYRSANKDHYYEYKHDRDPDQGWREKDTWWDKK